MNVIESECFILNKEFLGRQRHDILWKRPALLIKHNKDIIRNKGESMAERLGECPLLLRIRNIIPIDEEDLAKFNSQGNKGKINLISEKETQFIMYVYGDKTTGEEHVAVIKGVGNGENVPIRIHSSCLTAETFHASNCDCHEQLEKALAIAESEERGGVIWLHQEGRGNGLAAKAKQLKIMIEEDVDTVEAFKKAGYPSDQRDYSVASDILKDLGIKSIRLITNNPDKIKQISETGIVVTERIPCEVEPVNKIVEKDLKAKKTKLGHLFSKS